MAKKLYYLIANGRTTGAELWVRELATGKTERVLPGYFMDDFSVSRDGKQVAFASYGSERSLQPVGRTYRPQFLATTYRFFGSSRILQPSCRMVI